jgi:hypothetical protein
MFINDHPYKPKKICNMQPQLHTVVPINERFSCKQVQTHQCVSSFDYKTAASLVLKSFELEIDADPDEVKRGNFDKSEYAYSCNSWYYQ